MTSNSNITLISGSADLLVNRAIKKTIADTKKVNPTIIINEIDAMREDSYSTLMDAISPNLFGDASLIIIDRINVAEDNLDEKLVQTLKNIKDYISDDNYLIVIHRGGAGGTGIVKALQKLKIEEIKCENIKFPGGFIDFARSEFKLRKRKINEDASEALLNAIGDDLEGLASAINQLCFDVQTDPIDLESVKKYYSGVASVQGYEISSALWNGNVDLALDNLYNLFENDSNSGVYVVAMMGNSLRKLVKLSAIPASTNDYAIAQELSVNPASIKYLKMQLKHWTPTSLANAVVELAKVDAYMRAGYEGVSLDANQKRFLLETTIRKIGTAAR